MCSRVSNFLNRGAGINRKGEVLRKRRERWRGRGRQMRSVRCLPTPTKVLCNWMDLISVCFFAFLVCMFGSENISSHRCLFRGHQFYLSSLFHIAPCKSLSCSFLDADDCFLLLSWIFRNGTCEMQNVHSAALHRFRFLAWSHFSARTLGSCTLQFTAVRIGQLYV